MKSRFSSLLFLLSFSLTAQALEFQPEISGFLYNTSFSNPNFQTGRTVLAVNTDLAAAEGLAVRGQFSSYDQGTMRRLTVEADSAIGSGTEVVLRIGRFSRLSSFYNAVLDTPSSYGTAMLPLAGYNYRMFNGGFVLMDGSQIELSDHRNDVRWSLVASYGKMVVPSQSDLNKELFKRLIPNLQFSPLNTYDIGLHVESENLHLYTSQSSYAARVDAVSRDPVAVGTSRVFHSAYYTTTKFGAQYHTNMYFAQSEVQLGDTRAYAVSGAPSFRQRAQDVNLVGGWNATSVLSFYGGFSHGENVTSRRTDNDRFVGSTVIVGPFTSSLEYHRGSGTAWTKYDSPLSRWESFVLSTSYQF